MLFLEYKIIIFHSYKCISNVNLYFFTKTEALHISEIEFEEKSPTCMQIPRRQSLPQKTNPYCLICGEHLLNRAMVIKFCIADSENQLQ